MRRGVMWRSTCTYISVVRTRLPFTSKALVTIPLALITPLWGWASGELPQYTITSPPAIGPHLESRFNERQIALLEKLNRSDRGHLSSAARLVVPQDWTLDELDYSPLPPRYDLKSTPNKLLLVHLPSQVFGAYERGKLVHWGPVSSGAIHSPTRPGRYHLNWRSAGRCSTINPEWYMPWYFNFDNAPGLAFHEYTLPGKPDSHGCLRLLQRDAKWLYEWGEAAADCVPDGKTGQGTTVLISAATTTVLNRPGIPTIGGRRASHSPISYSTAKLR